MTKKDYELIAGVIRESPDREAMCEYFILQINLTQDKEGFNPTKFKVACGVEK